MYCFRSILLLSFLIFANHCFSQVVVVGKVTDDSNNGISGVNVTIKGINVGTVSDVEGNYTFVIEDTSKIQNPDSITVVVSLIGFQNYELKVRPNQPTNKSFGGDLKVSAAYALQFPQFPWPPPEFSTKHVLDGDFFEKSTSMKDVDRILSKALRRCGYGDKGYFQVPGGFALATQIEQTEEDGVPLEPPQRWSTKTHFTPDFWNYVRSIVFPVKGHFRVFVFVVSDRPFNSSGDNVSYTEAIAWLREGVNMLPKEIEKLKFDPQQHHCTVLVYEFEQIDNYEANINVPGRLDSTIHLEKSRISKTLSTR